MKTLKRIFIYFTAIGQQQLTIKNMKLSDIDKEIKKIAIPIEDIIEIKEESNEHVTVSTMAHEGIISSYIVNASFDDFWELLDE